MLAGYPPFFDDNPFGIYEKILAGKIEWPRQLDPVAKDLVKKLLVQDRTKRLGNMKVGTVLDFIKAKPLPACTPSPDAVCMTLTSLACRAKQWRLVCRHPG